ncbi:MAG: hypothetical protein HP052_01565 [Firmicutes bacterium]|nr:hypothetical protein [Bacillota bacterium]
MISGKQLHGLKVVDKNGVVLGVVHDLLADRQSGIIKGFIVNLPGFISTLAFLPGKDVISMDLTGMIIADKDCFQRMPKAKEKQRSLMRMGEIDTSKGYITDIFLEPDRISAVELSQGVLNDIRKGRETIPWDEM